MVREQPLFFDLGQDRLYGFLHLPPDGSARRGVVICDSIAEEKLWSHRVFVTLARELARSGTAVLRFDYRGEGESDLDFEQAGIATRAEDAVRAAEVLLAEQPRLSGVTLIGHRLGGAIAAIAAARLGPRAREIVIWDPVSSGRDFLMQWLRANLAKQMAVLGKATQTRAELVATLEAGGAVTVEGYCVKSPLYEELMALKWPPLLHALPCRGLVVFSDKVAGFPAEGGQLSHSIVREPAFWREQKSFYCSAPQMTQASMKWLEESYA